jgi:hypothetical protein
VVLELEEKVMMDIGLRRVAYKTETWSRVRGGSLVNEGMRLEVVLQLSMALQASSQDHGHSSKSSEKVK